MQPIGTAAAKAANDLATASWPNATIANDAQALVADLHALAAAATSTDDTEGGYFENFASAYTGEHDGEARMAFDLGLTSVAPPSTTTTLVPDMSKPGYKVLSCNMFPTLQPGYYVVIKRPPGAIKRGDIVYFLPPISVRSSADDIRVSRVVGMPGDHLGTEGGKVTVDGAVDSENYLPSGTVTDGLAAQSVPAGAYFVMGDNRGDSQDSRYYGPISGSDIQAQAIAIEPGSGSGCS